MTMVGGLFVHWVLPVLINVGMWLAGWYAHRSRIEKQLRKRFPYRWVCTVEDCPFVFAANDVMLVDQAAVTHQQDHVRRHR